MRRTVRVVVVNEDEAFSALIRSELLSVQGVQIVAEVSELALADQAVRQFPAEIVLVHLDPSPKESLPVATSIAAAKPGTAVFVVSANADPQLILTAMRSGVREFLTKPIDRQLLTTGIEKASAAVVNATQVGRLISVMSTIGGAGASMLATNLAVELRALSGERPVAVVDLDFRYGQLATMLDLQADYTIADLCDTPEQLDPAMVERAMVKHGSGVHLLARPNSFGQADHISAAHCVAVLTSLQQMYGYVVVDGPIRFDPGGLAVLDLADTNLFVVQLLVTSVRNVHRMFSELRDGGYNMDRFRLVCNRVGLESGHLELGHVEKILNRKIDHEIPDDWKTISGSVNVGTPLIEYAPRSRVRSAIRELAESIAARPEDEIAAKVNVKSSLLGRIFSQAAS